MPKAKPIPVRVAIASQLRATAKMLKDSEETGLGEDKLSAVATRLSKAANLKSLERAERDLAEVFHKVEQRNHEYAAELQKPDERGRPTVDYFDGKMELLGACGDILREILFSLRHVQEYPKDWVEHTGKAASKDSSAQSSK